MSLINHIFHTQVSASKQKVYANIYWAVLGKCVTLLSSLIVGIIVARYLGKEQYGLMNYVMSIVAIFQVFAHFGIDNIQIREEARHIENKDVLIGTSFVLKLVMAAIVLASICVYTFLFQNDSQTRLLILLYSITVVFNTSWVIRNHFSAIVWNEYVVKTEISRTVVGLLVKLALLYLHAPLEWFVAALVFDSILLAIGYALSYRSKIDKISKWSFDIKCAKYILEQSFPLLLSGAAIVIYNKIDQVMIGSLLDKASVGVYSVAVRFVEVLVFVPTIIAQTVSPLLVKALKENLEKYDRLATVFMSVTVWFCVIASVLVSVLSYPIVLLTFGPEYISAAVVLSIMSFKVIGDALSQTSGQLIIIEGKQKYVSLRNVFGCVVCIVLNYLVIRPYGVNGAAVVSIVTIFSSGFLANLFIPLYRDVFVKQVASLVLGWRNVFNIKSYLS